jgi:hypothetical protein
MGQDRIGAVHIDENKAVEFLYSSDPDTQAIGLCGSIQFGISFGEYPKGVVNGKKVAVTYEKLVDVSLRKMLNHASPIADEWITREAAREILCAFVEDKLAVGHLFSGLRREINANGVNQLNAPHLLELCSRAVYSSVQNEPMVDVSEAVLSYAVNRMGPEQVCINADALLNLCYSVACSGRQSQGAGHILDVILSRASEDALRLKVLSAVDAALEHGVDVSGLERALGGVKGWKRGHVRKFGEEVRARAERLNYNAAHIGRESYGLDRKPERVGPDLNPVSSGGKEIRTPAKRC